MDGNTSQQYGSKSCTRTQNSNQPWWKLDFGGTNTTISQVQVWNCANCSSNQLDGVEVKVGNTLCGTLNGSSFVQSVDCANAQGLFVQLQKPGSGLLSLCEVMVYGPERAGRVTILLLF